MRRMTPCKTSFQMGPCFSITLGSVKNSRRYRRTEAASAPSGVPRLTSSTAILPDGELPCFESPGGVNREALFMSAEHTSWQHVAHAGLLPDGPRHRLPEAPLQLAL